MSRCADQGTRLLPRGRCILRGLKRLHRGISPWPFGVRPGPLVLDLAAKQHDVELECDVWAADICNPAQRDALRDAALIATKQQRAAGRTGPSLAPDATFSAVLSLAPLWAEERQRRAAAGAIPGSTPLDAWRSIPPTAAVASSLPEAENAHRPDDVPLGTSSNNFAELHFMHRYLLRLGTSI